MLSERVVDPSGVKVKIGADDGQGIQMICAQLLSSEEVIIPEIQELHQNLKILIDELSLASLKNRHSS